MIKGNSFHPRYEGFELQATVISWVLIMIKLIKEFVVGRNFGVSVEIDFYSFPHYLRELEGDLDQERLISK